MGTDASTRSRSTSGCRILVLKRKKAPEDLLDFILERTARDIYGIRQLVNGIPDEKLCFKSMTYAEALRVQASLREWKTKQ